MSNTGPVIIDRPRVKDDPSPVESFTYAGDLDGHTATLVVEGAGAAGADATVTGSVSPTATLSTMTFTISSNAALVAAAAGAYPYSVILDVASPTLRRTIIAGDWIVADYPG